jgi:hypothetical protein
MTNLTLEQIKKQFEHRDFFYRSQFITEYDFNDAHLAYYQSFLNGFNYKSKRHYYVSDLINLATDLALFEDVLCQKYLDLLNQNCHLVIKLSVIDYVSERHKTLGNTPIEAYLLPHLKPQMSNILRNKILISLLVATNKTDYFDFLMSSLLSTKNARSFYKTLANDDLFSIKPNYQRGILTVIASRHKSKQFGEGVTELLKERKMPLKKFISRKG